MKTGSHWIVDDDRFLIRRLEDESIVLDLQSGDYYTASGSASLVLGFVLEDASADSIRKALKREYPNIPDRTLDGDLDAFLSSLRLRGIARPAAR